MKKYFLSALMLMGITASAQTITFDTDDYTSVGVYDTWEQSPFRTGALKGNAKVLPNPLTDVDPVLEMAPNATENVVGVQRSRFGSNTFGVRVDLKEPFRLTKDLRYIHVMCYMPNKPVESRMMVVGLGKRVESDWSWQTGEDEQFWAITSTPVKASSSWQDIVVSVKGFSYSVEENAESGIDIHSLVIIPDVRSPHADNADWAAYFDQIVIDESSEKRFTTEKYAISFASTQTVTRTDRVLNGVGLGTQSVSGLGSYIYNDKTTSTVFSAIPGESVAPKFTYTGTWMSGYVYVDWGNDGKFTSTINEDGTPADGSDIVSYSAYTSNNSTWYKSDGTTASNGNTIQSGVPTFTIPAEQAKGFYRMRYKVDWNSIDPAGNSNSNNLIVNNGGGIADILLDIHDTEVLVTDGQLNGAVVLADGTELNEYKAPYGQALTVKLDPAPGFTHNGMIIRYGYNLTGPQFDDNGNPQWLSDTIPASAFKDNEYTIPGAQVVGGTLLVEGLMVEQVEYAVVVSGAPEGEGGVVYDGVTYKGGENVVASVLLTVDDLAAVEIDSYYVNVTLEGKEITVTYTYYEKCDVTYSYTWNGTERATESFVSVKGEEWPTPTKLSAFAAATLPEGTVNGSGTFEVPVVNYPFASYDTPEEIATWYNITIKSSSYWSLNAGGKSIDMVAEVDDASGNGLWGFTGNPFDGIYQVYNIVAGTTKVLTTKTNIADGNTGGSTYPFMQEASSLLSTQTNTWKATASTYAPEGFYLAHSKSASAILNLRDGKLAYWNGGADLGSTLNVYEASVPTSIQGVSVDTTISQRIYDLQGRQLGHVNGRGIYVVNGKKIIVK